MIRALAFAAVFIASSAGPAALAQQGQAPRPDLADLAAGEYHGDVISDARGASRSDVTITVTKTGPNTVQVVSSYARLPTISTQLTRVMDTVQNTGNPAGKLQVFLLDTKKTPMRLDLTIDDASWSGEKAG